MFTSFIYTECVSPGPFKRESGFKFKSVMAHDDEFEQTEISQQQESLDRAAGKFPPYVAPRIDSFMKPEEFLALEKQWSLQPIGSNQYLFCRQFTSGVSNGRPDNPFHQGFVFDDRTVSHIVKATAELSGFEFARPADYSTWTDWQNPRGDQQLEAASLESDNPPTPVDSTDSWLRSIQRLIENSPEISLRNLATFELAISLGSAAELEAANSSEFLLWVSGITHFMPLENAWTTSFSSSENTQAFPPSLGGLAFIRNRGTRPVLEPGPWSKLAMLVVESGSHSFVESTIGRLSAGLNFPQASGASALSMLPIACLFIDDKDTAPEDFGAMVELAYESLRIYSLPTSWKSRESLSTNLDLLDSPGALAHKLPNSNSIYSLLANLPCED